MVARDELPDTLTRGAFTTTAARGAGVGRGRLRGADLVRPHHGVRVSAELAAADLRSRCLHLLPALGPDDWFSHVTAARLWGMPVSWAYTDDEPLHVTRVGALTPSRHARVTGWVTADANMGRRVVEGIPLLAPAEVWCQLAQRGAVRARTTTGHEWLVAAADHLLTGPRIGRGRRGPSLATVDQLERAVGRRTGARGVKRLRDALADSRSPVDSPYETLMRLRLRAHGVAEPVVQAPVATVQRVLHADLGWPAQRVALEYQGDEHRVSRSRWLYDLTRVQLMQDAGWHVLLAGHDDLRAGAMGLAARVRRALAARA